MKLAFVSNSLRDLCLDFEIARERLGEEVASKLKVRLADLRAAEMWDELIIGTPRAIPGTDHMEIVIHEATLMIVTAGGVQANVRNMETGAIDWNRVSRIKILKVGDHE